MTYYDTGQVASATDPCGNLACADMSGGTHTTKYSYMDNWASGSSSGNTNAYLTKIADSLGHVTQYSYNFGSGEVASGTDENAGTTTYSYNDPLLRLTDVYGPPSAQNNGGRPHTNTAYVDGYAASVTVTSPIGGKSITATDGVGHPIKQQTIVASGVIQAVDKTYNGMGQVQSVSNPYIDQHDPSYGVTQYFYDGLGRKTLQLQPDNVTTTTTAPTGTATFTYSSAQQWIYNGNVATFADEASHQWRRTTDGLGRLSAVSEPGGLQTTYTYDGLNDLGSVTQSGANGDAPRTRTFVYDSLSRLLTATNPETGTVCYGQWNNGKCVNGYDGNGNLQYKTDARGATTKYFYDALNRMTAKSYTGGPGYAPSSCYQYDSAASVTNPVGRLVAEWTQPGNCPTDGSGVPGNAFTYRTIAGYDDMGRLTGETQCAVAPCAASALSVLAYTYDLAGNPIGTNSGVVSGASPAAGLMWSGTFDGAGRPDTLTSSWNDAAHPGQLFQANATTASIWAFLRLMDRSACWPRNMACRLAI